MRETASSLNELKEQSNKQVELLLKTDQELIKIREEKKAKPESFKEFAKKEDKKVEKEMKEAAKSSKIKVPEPKPQPPSVGKPNVDNETDSLKTSYRESEGEGEKEIEEVVKVSKVPEKEVALLNPSNPFYNKLKDQTVASSPNFAQEKKPSPEKKEVQDSKPSHPFYSEMNRPKPSAESQPAKTNSVFIAAKRIGTKANNAFSSNNAFGSTNTGGTSSKFSVIILDSRSPFTNTNSGVGSTQGNSRFPFTATQGSGPFAQKDQTRDNPFSISSNRAGGNSYASNNHMDTSDQMRSDSYEDKNIQNSIFPFRANNVQREETRSSNGGGWNSKSNNLFAGGPRNQKDSGSNAFSMGADSRNNQRETSSSAGNSLFTDNRRKARRI